MKTACLELRFQLGWAIALIAVGAAILGMR